MELLMLEDYPSVGYVGQIVNVKKGYARNFLIPKGFGVEVNSRRAKYFKHIHEGVERKRNKLKSEAETFGAEVQKHKLKFKLKVGESGKSFGSITVRDILKELNNKGGYSFDRKQLRLQESIKTPGTYSVILQLHSDVSVDIEVEVEGIKQKSSAPKPVAKKRDFDEEYTDGEIDSADAPESTEDSAEDSPELEQAQES